jgi:protein-disulfide isomerase
MIKKILPYIIIAAAAIGAGALGAWLYGVKKGPSYQTKSGRPGAQPAQMRGPSRPRATIEEFADFQCPTCGKLYPKLKEIEGKYGSSVTIIFREYPMPKLHANALEAARAAEAAGLQGAFWDMHDFIFETQETWSDWKEVRSLFARQATLMGFDPTKLRQDMDSVEVQKRIAADIERGDSLGIQGTPTVFLNGRMLTPEEVERINELLDAMVGQPGSSTPSPSPSSSP